MRHLLVAAKPEMRIGIDLGGTKTEIAAYADGQELIRQRIATPQGDYMATVMAIAGLVETVENTLGRRGSVGIGRRRQAFLFKSCQNELIDPIGRPVLLFD